MLGSREELFNASQGRMAPRAAAAPSPVIQPYTGGFDTASLTNNLAQTQLANGSSLIPNIGRANGGLSAKGKYGGFFSAGDEQAAIEGSARNIKNSADTYRAKADAFMNKLNPIYTEAAAGPSRAFIHQGTSQMPGVNENQQSINPNGYIAKIVNPSRQYASQLNDWYAQQSAPAVKYKATADQIDRTGISSLATQIATSNFGMNPDLAAGKFAGLDKTYYTEQQDAKSMAEHGMPAAEWKAQNEDNLYGTSAKKIAAGDEQFASSELDKVTNLGSKYLSAATGQTAAQMYNVLDKKFTYTNPLNKTQEEANGTSLAAQYSQYITEGNGKAAQDLLNSIPADRQDLKRLLQAMQSVALMKFGKSAINTMTYNPLAGVSGG
jgi:hypothetical protein